MHGLREVGSTIVALVAGMHPNSMPHGPLSKIQARFISGKEHSQSSRRSSFPKSA